MSNIQLTVLDGIRQFLNVFNDVQQLVSAEKTPTLAIVLPVYEQLITILNGLKREIPNLAHAISASIEKLEEYMSKARATDMYILAMCEAK